VKNPTTISTIIAAANQAPINSKEPKKSDSNRLTVDLHPKSKTVIDNVEANTSLSKNSIVGIIVDDFILNHVLQERAERPSDRLHLIIHLLNLNPLLFCKLLNNNFKGNLILTHFQKPTALDEFIFESPSIQDFCLNSGVSYDWLIYGKGRPSYNPAIPVEGLSKRLSKDKSVHFFKVIGHDQIIITEEVSWDLGRQSVTFHKYLGVITPNDKEILASELNDFTSTMNTRIKFWSIPSFNGQDAQSGNLANQAINLNICQSMSLDELVSEY